MKTIMRTLLLVVAAAWLTACSEEVNEPVNTDPVAFHAGDECHVCGMIIVEWPGPKAESINKQSGQTLKFCATTDLFAWWLQPENRTVQAQIYVHDMGQAHWDKPEDEYLVDARDAWYVVGTDLVGAMGPTLISFADKDAAQALVNEQGGRILSFNQIDIAVLQEIGQAGHKFAASHGHELRQSMGVEEKADIQSPIIQP